MCVFIKYLNLKMCCKISHSNAVSWLVLASDFRHSSRPHCWGRRSCRPPRPAGGGTGSPSGRPASQSQVGEWCRSEWVLGPRRRYYQNHSPLPWPTMENIIYDSFQIQIFKMNFKKSYNIAWGFQKNKSDYIILLCCCDVSTNPVKFPSLPTQPIHNQLSKYIKPF